MNNLKILRKRKGVAQKDVAEYLGVTTSAYGQYETGSRSMNHDVISKLSDYFDVSSDVILGRLTVSGDVAIKEIVVKPEIEYEDEIWLPVVASLHCGYGVAGEPFTIIDRQKVPKSYKTRYGDGLVLNYATGDSMFPTIKSGDLMLCYPGDIWDDGTIVILDINGSDTVKRIYHAYDGGIDLIPDNPKYKSVHYSPEDVSELHIQVLGHVITVLPKEFTPIPRRGG